MKFKEMNSKDKELIVRTIKIVQELHNAWAASQISKKLDVSKQELQRRVKDAVKRLEKSKTI